MSRGFGTDTKIPCGIVNSSYSTHYTRRKMKMTKNYETENKNMNSNTDKASDKSAQNCGKNSSKNASRNSSKNKTTNAYDREQNNYSDRY
jgi:Sec-independent protein translocase protein TatA